MKKTRMKKILSTIMVVVLLVSIVPSFNFKGISAEENTNLSVEFAGNTTISRPLSDESKLKFYINGNEERNPEEKIKLYLNGEQYGADYDITTEFIEFSPAQYETDEKSLGDGFHIKIMHVDESGVAVALLDENFTLLKQEQAGISIKQSTDTLTWSDTAIEISSILEVSGGSGSGNFVYNVITNNNVATINNTDNTKININKSGTFKIEVYRKGDTNYKDSEKKITENYSVSKKSQEIYIEKFESDNASDRVFNYGKQSISLNDEEYLVYSKNGDKVVFRGADEFNIKCEKIGDVEVASVDSDGKTIKFKDNGIGQFKLVVSRDADEKYNAASKEYTLTVKSNGVFENVEPTIEGEKADENSDWYTSDILIKAPVGYLISKTNTLDPNSFSDSVSITSDGEDNGLPVYFKNKENGNISEGYDIDSALLKKCTSRPQLSIEYENVNIDNGLNELLKNNFIFFKDEFDVTFKAISNISVINFIEWKYTRAEKVSDINVENLSGIIDIGNIAYNKEEKCYYTTISLPTEYSNQLRGFFSFTAKNEAGLDNTITDDRCVVYDTEKPEREITLRNPVSKIRDENVIEDDVSINDYSEDKLKDMSLYYDEEGTSIQLQIMEANFWSDKVEISVISIDNTGKETTQSFNHNSEDWISDDDYHTINIPIQNEGKYKIKVNYSDYSNNIMDSYESPYIIIDKTLPTSESRLSAPKKERDNKLYYDSDATFTITIDELNFNADDVDITDTVKASYASDSESVTKKCAATWKNVNGKHVGTIKLTSEGEHFITVNYKDLAGNKMEECVSDRIVIDKTNPVVSVDFSGKKTSKEGDRYYYSNKQTMTITVVDDNFDVNAMSLKMEAKNSSGKDVKIADYAKEVNKASNWKHDKGLHTLQLKISEDAIFTTTIECKDLALRDAEKEKTYFTIDTNNPKELSISYSEGVDKIKIGNYFNRYYNKKVTVTIIAKDDTSGIKKIAYSYVKDKGVSSVNKSLIQQAVSSSKIQHIKGTNIYKTTFKITKAALGPNNQFRGKVNFTAIDKAQNQKTKKDKTKVIVDNIAPKGSVELSKPVNQVNGVSYYTGNIVARISIKEANFNGNDVVVRVNNSTQKVKKWINTSGDNWTGSITISNDGDYEIGVSYKDKSSNVMRPYKSGKLTIDRQSPTIRVEGIKNKSANKQDVIGATITFSDTNLSSDANVKLVAKYLDNGVVKTKNIDVSKVSNAKEKAVYKVENLKEDGLYSLTCSAKDNAGNSVNTFAAEGSNVQLNDMEFSVNRNGSVFVLGEYAEEIGKRFYVTDVKSDIIIEEINVDFLKSYKVEVNGQELKEDSDYSVKKNSLNGSWNKYTYTINKENFKNEGRYSIVISSVDEADGKAYSDLKSTEEKFVVDKTKPSVKVTGIIKGGRYKVDKKKVIITPEDVGGEIDTLRVEVSDSDDNIISTPIDLSGDELKKALEKNDNIEFYLDEGMYQTVDIICVDKANNQYVTSDEYSGVTVSSNVAVIAWSNTLVRWIFIIGLIAVIGGVAFIIVYRKRK